jgi:gamma-glutamylaminecyclotransferase
MATTVLFIYGSLKRGQSNHRVIADQEYRGEAVTMPRYRIIDLGRYGGLVRDDAAGVAVKGELWAVSECGLAELDDFETGEGLWVRYPVAVQGRESVEAYFWTGAVPGGVRSADEWPFESPGTAVPGL